jgi:hypothetical protein
VDLGLDAKTDLIPRNLEIVGRLKADPEFRRSPEIASQTQSGIRRHGPLPVHDLADSDLPNADRLK